MSYQSIVFIQGDEYDEIPTIRDSFPDYDAVIDYLSQWDYGDEGETTETLGEGTSDTVIRRTGATSDGYVLVVNRALGYAGLSIELPDMEA